MRAIKFIGQTRPKKNRNHKEITAMLQKTKVKKVFNDEGIQLPEETFMLIDDEVKRIITRWAKRTVDGNVKRLTPDLFWVALGRYNQ